ncbi:MAG: DGQHR domain-containing protein [Lachnospiraceae bacterium]|nr:DGQHR domain-containing protein [Lachnospiraceae bacterium]
MKKIYLIKITQFSKECYVGRIDPRKLVRVATEVGMSETQEAQRPLNEKRVKDISNYVSNEKGILPNTLTLATKDNKFDVVKVDGIEDLYYIEFPDNEDEFKVYKETIDVMDGQHRLYSFLPDISNLEESATYEIGFTLYIRPTLRERQKIFISCNEKQEKVSNNLLIWFKSKLNMLQAEEKELYDLVNRLNEEYPLKNHIIMSAEKIKNGIKAKELMAVIKKAGITKLQIMGADMDIEQEVKVLSTYLTAWENVVDFNFATSNAKEAGAAIKIAGVRFMLTILPCVWERSIQLQQPYTTQFVEDTLKKMIADMGVEREEFFTCEKNKMYFRERSQTEAFAEECVKKIKNIGSQGFNPLG